MASAPMVEPAVIGTLAPGLPASHPTPAEGTPS
jgi:hypothetical protein